MALTTPETEKGNCQFIDPNNPLTSDAKERSRLAGCDAK
jgi:hypothetical protein